jgi:hypothetical protein
MSWSRDRATCLDAFSGWREEFLAGGAQTLKRRTDDPQAQALEAERERLKAALTTLTHSTIEVI